MEISAQSVSPGRVMVPTSSAPSRTRCGIQGTTPRGSAYKSEMLYSYSCILGFPSVHLQCILIPFFRRAIIRMVVPSGRRTRPAAAHADPEERGPLAGSAPCGLWLPGFVFEV